MSPEALLEQGLLPALPLLEDCPISPKTSILFKPVPPPKLLPIFFFQSEILLTGAMGFSSYVHTALR